MTTPCLPFALVSYFLAHSLQLRQAHLVLSPIQVTCGVVRRGKPAEDDKDSHEDEGNDSNAAEHGAAVAEIGPLPASLTRIALDRLVAELVVDHAAKRNAVAEELEPSDLGAPNHHGGEDEEDILEHTAQSEDEGRGLADLLQKG